MQQKKPITQVDPWESIFNSIDSGQSDTNSLIDKLPASTSLTDTISIISKQNENESDDLNNLKELFGFEEKEETFEDKLINILTPCKINSTHSPANTEENIDFIINSLLSIKDSLASLPALSLRNDNNAKKIFSMMQCFSKMLHANAEPPSFSEATDFYIAILEIKNTMFSEQIYKIMNLAKDQKEKKL